MGGVWRGVWESVGEIVKGMSAAENALFPPHLCSPLSAAAPHLPLLTPPFHTFQVVPGPSEEIKVVQSRPIDRQHQACVMECLVTVALRIGE